MKAKTVGTADGGGRGGSALRWHVAIGAGDAPAMAPFCAAVSRALAKVAERKKMRRKEISMKWTMRSEAGIAIHLYLCQRIIG